MQDRFSSEEKNFIDGLMIAYQTSEGLLERGQKIIERQASQIETLIDLVMQSHPEIDGSEIQRFLEKPKLTTRLFG